MRPVVLVHGILDSARRIAPLRRGLEQRGIARVHAFDLLPPWGTERIELLAEQLARVVATVRQEHAVDAVDVVGFSMGALVTRVYLERLGGAAHVRTFVSISGPHQGTFAAYVAPFAGVKQMRPGSPLLRSLGADVSHLAGVAVHCIYTPFDLSIVPATSSILRGAKSVHGVPVLVHRWMLMDRRVLDLVAGMLRAGHTDEAAAVQARTG